MKRIVSFSLWGTGAKYWVGASRNVALVRQHYPGWGCRFYVDSSCDPVLASGLSAALDPQMDGIEVVPSRGPYHGMFWRFTPAFDESVDAFVSRDCDSRISTREASAVAEWLGSGMEFHAMRDHPFHNMPIQGGMWGCRSGLLRRLGLEPAFSAWTDFSRWGCDQEFLSRHVYPAVRHVTLEHNGFPPPGPRSGMRSAPSRRTARIGDSSAKCSTSWIAEGTSTGSSRATTVSSADWKP